MFGAGVSRVELHVCAGVRVRFVLEPLEPEVDGPSRHIVGIQELPRQVLTDEEGVITGQIAVDQPVALVATEGGKGIDGCTEEGGLIPRSAVARLDEPAPTLGERAVVLDHEDARAVTTESLPDPVV